MFSRLKGEENTVMIDYVLPDFSTIKKGFCKVNSETLGICSSEPLSQFEEHLPSREDWQVC